MSQAADYLKNLLTVDAGREIPEDVAAKTDRDNEFPMEMWRKFGKAEYDLVI